MISLLRWIAYMCREWTWVVFASSFCIVLPLQRNVIAIHFVCLNPPAISLHCNQNRNKSSTIGIRSIPVILFGPVASSRFNRLVSLWLPVSCHNHRLSCSSPPLRLYLLVSLWSDVAAAMAIVGFLLLHRHWINRESPATVVLTDSALLWFQRGTRESQAVKATPQLSPTLRHTVLDIRECARARHCCGGAGGDSELQRLRYRQRRWSCAPVQAIPTFVRSRHRLPIADPRVDRNCYTPTADSSCYKIPLLEDNQTKSALCYIVCDWSVFCYPLRLHYHYLTKHFLSAS
jgi:hypothetical protein